MSKEKRKRKREQGKNKKSTKEIGLQEKRREKMNEKCGSVYWVPDIE